MKRLALFVCALCVFFPFVASAAGTQGGVALSKTPPMALSPTAQGTAVPSRALDPAANPALGMFLQMGAKLYYMGQRAGMEGWFIVKDGQVQMAYSAPDGHSVIVGALFGESGENITAVQVENLIRSNKEVATLVQNAQQAPTAGAGLLPGQENGQIPVQPAPAFNAKGLPTGVPLATGAGVQPTQQTAAAPLSPGEMLLRDLSGAAGVIAGNPRSPELLMIMDPRCPHCQATWRALHDSLAQGMLHVRLIPISAQGGDSERAAAMLLSSADPMSAWDKYIGGDKTALDGTPSPRSAQPLTQICLWSCVGILM